MKYNKLIAEFMGLETPDGCYFEHLTKEGNRELTHHILLQYHTSWDWLMPVVQKCFDTQKPEEGQHYFINESLLTIKIEVVYDRVVEFIKEHNEVDRLVYLSKYTCDSCGDRTDRVAFNEDKDINECMDCI